MKKLLIIIFISLSLFAEAQTPPGYTLINSRYKWLSGIFQSLHAPQFCGFPTLATGQWVGDGAIGIDTCNNKFYIYSGATWRAWADSASLAGAGTPNTNLGSGFRLVVPSSQGIKSLLGVGITIDSGTANSLTLTANKGTYALYQDSCFITTWPNGLKDTICFSGGASTGTVTSVGLTAGTSGTDVNITGSPVTTSGNLNINIPDASATARGLITTGSQTLAGTKTFSNNIIGSSSITVSGNATATLFRATELGSTPSTPPSGFGDFWVKNDGTAHYLNDAGVDIQLGSGGGGSSAEIADSLKNAWMSYGSLPALGFPKFGTNNNKSINVFTNNTYRGVFDSTGRICWGCGAGNYSAPLFSVGTAGTDALASAHFGGGFLSVASSGTPVSGFYDAFRVNGWNMIGVPTFASAGTLAFGSYTASQWTALRFYTSTGGTGERLLLNNTEVVVNDISEDIDFRVEGNTDANLIYADAGTDNVGIGKSGASEKLDVAGNVRFSGAIMPNNNAGTTGQVLTSAGTGAAPTWTNLASGTYTPTATNGTNVSASTPGQAQYMRVGNTVTVSGQVSITCTTLGIASQIDLSLPIASAFTTTVQLSGTMLEAVTGVTSPGHGTLASEATNDRIEILFTPRTTGSLSYRYTYTYEVL